MSHWDQQVLQFLVRHRTPWLTTAMRLLTNLGSARVLLPLALLAALAYWWRRRDWRPGALLGAAYLGSLALSQAGKILTHRLRPPVALRLGQFTGSSFPSGHATQAAAVWGMGALLVAAAARRPGSRAAVWMAAGAVVALVGISRLYLAAHWLSDVLAGVLLGAAWLAFLAAVGWAGRIRSAAPAAPAP